MERKINNETLIAYLNRELNEADCRRVESWYLKSEENQKLMEQLYFTLFISDRISALNKIEIDRSLAELKRKIRNRTPEAEPRRRYLKYIFRVAAAAIFVGIVFIGGLTISQLSESLSKPFAVVTGLGERAQTILPDGSKVWVGACSKVEYYPPFLFAKERKVNLVGEAYFEVESDEEHPFVVNSNEFQTSVLGTKFNIRSNQDDRFVTMTLIEGVIQITSPKLGDKKILMHPREQFRFDNSTGESAFYACAAAEEYISWIDGKLYFEQTTLEEIAISLERYYNINITITSEKLRKERFTCDFETTENIYQIFSILKLTKKFNYKVNNRNIEINAI
jgi:ferric-dicitrate binding protein FerR (iron transport regulator)